jgi:hypothetical protein
MKLSQNHKTRLIIKFYSKKPDGHSHTGALTLFPAQVKQLVEDPVHEPH